jgi:hypothetical protein
MTAARISRKPRRTKKLSPAVGELGRRQTTTPKASQYAATATVVREIACPRSNTSEARTIWTDEMSFAHCRRLIQQQICRGFVFRPASHSPSLQGLTHPIPQMGRNRVGAAAFLVANPSLRLRPCIHGARPSGGRDEIDGPQALGGGRYAAIILHAGGARRPAWGFQPFRGTGIGLEKLPQKGKKDPLEFRL